MKKRNLFSSLFLVLLFAASCQKQSSIKIAEPEQISAEVSSALVENNLENLKLTFELLSAEEKFEYWKARISVFSKSRKFNSEQLVLISELMANLKMDFFKQNKAHLVELDRFSRDWFAKAVSSFTISDIILLTVLTPTNSKDITNNITNSETEPFDDALKCKCLATATVTHCSFYNDRECKLNLGGCTLTSIGCGFLGLYGCDGRCEGT